MFKSLRTLAFATLLPFALPTLAQVNATLPANVQKALQTNKLTGNDLSLVL
ncbi:TPA: D-alanyl-D-alanine carboxypeptidase/D-alanyl-D-alanine-endopeptidase, partial [Pseudomonas aeruginosa]|nr:D-alanyl-D-alanine carboxypeptidase/D-alanyl-D-alanine-endopeptidase [Pseudomonas aeruginosa]